MSQIAVSLSVKGAARHTALALLLATVTLGAFAQGWVGVGRSMREDTRSVAFGPVDGGDGHTYYWAFSGHKHYGVFRAYSTAEGAGWGPWQPTPLNEYELFVPGSNNTGAAAVVNVVVTSGEYASQPVVLAGTSSGKVYRSVDHGATWTAAAGLPGSAIFDLAFSGSRVLAATGSDGVYRSMDSGATFTPLAPALGPNPFLKIEPEIGGPNFFAVTAKTGDAPGESGGVYYWTGALWQNRSTGLPGWGTTIYSLTSLEAVDPPEEPPVTNVRLWLGDMNGSGVLLSDDLGLTWYPSCLSCDQVTCLTVSPDYTADNEHLLIGTNWGWYEHTKEGSVPSCSRRYPKGLAINSISADPVWSAAKPALWLATSDGIRYLAPGGFPAPPEQGDELSSMDVSFLAPSPHAVSDAILYAASRQFGVFRSLDRGETFHQYMPSLDDASSGASGAGARTPVTAIALSPSFTGGGTCSGEGAAVYMAADGLGVYQSSAAGSQWEPMTAGLTVAGSLRVSHLVHRPSTAPTPFPLFAGFADQARVVRYNATTSTWVAPTSNPGGTTTTALALPPSHNGVSDQTVFAGTDSGLFRSGDLGNTWQDDSLPGSGPVTAIAFSPKYDGTTNQKMFAARAGSGLYRKVWDATVPVGWKWFPVAGVTDANVTAVAVSPNFDHPLNDDMGVAIATGNPMSKDMGGVFVSIDGGATFTLQVTGLEDRQVRSLAVVERVTGVRLVAGVQRRRAFYADAPFAVSQAVSWVPSAGFESTTGQIRAVATSPAVTNIGCPHANPLVEGGGDIFIGGTAGVFWSNDGGETFRPMNQWLSGGWVCPPTVNALFAFVNPNGTGLLSGSPMPMLLAGTEGQGIWYRYASFIVYNTATGEGAWDWTQGVWVRSDLTAVSVRHFTRERTLSPLVIRAATDAGTWVSDQTVTTYGANWVYTGLPGEVTDIRSGQVPGALTIPDRPDAPGGNITWGTVSNNGVWRGIEGAKLATFAPDAVTWTERNGSGLGVLPSLNARSVLQLTDLTLLCGTQGSGVFLSEDEGVAWWEAAATALGGFSKPVTDFLESANGDVLCAVDSSASGGGVFLSGDRGRHWASISQGFDSTEQTLSSIVATSETPPVYYAGTYSQGSYATTITAQPYPTVNAPSEPGSPGLTVTSGSPSGGTVVTVNGTGFQNACPPNYSCPDASAVVVFGGTDAPTTFVGTTQLTATTPAHPEGPVEVWVRNPDTRAAKYAGVFTFDVSLFDLTVSRDGENLVRVAWVNAPGSGAKKLYRSPTPDFSQQVDTVSVTGTSGNHTYYDLSGTDGYLYFYKVTL